MKDKKTLFTIDILRNIIGVYFDTFFVFYFFKAANYAIVPLVEFYLIDYIVTGFMFILIRKGIKKNNKVPYFQIGISLEALYIAIIMLLKNNIVNYVYLIAIVKGLANAFYYFPRNIIESDKVNNNERQHYNGRISTINQIVAIIIPIILGTLLTYFSYTDLGKVFFILFIVMFIVAFKLKDINKNNSKFNFREFKKVLDKNKDIKRSLLIPFLAGFSYSSGVMTLVITLLKINIFKTNFNLGLVDSICAFLCLLMCILFTKKIKQHIFSTILKIAGILAFITLLMLAIFNNEIVFVIYLIIRFTCITIINLISATTIFNITNHKDIKESFKEEFYCAREIMFCIARSTGYLILIVVSSFLGNTYISYILILSGIAVLLEALILNRLVKNQV